VKLFRIFCIGLGISFLGALPLGTLNIAAMQLSISDGYLAAIHFSLGALTVEMLYVRISLAGISWVRKRKRFFRTLEWMAILVLLALSFGSFLAAFQNGHPKNIVLSNRMPRFLLGAAMSAVNPLQIPFWFGWSSLLMTKKILSPRHDHYTCYVAGIGLGTLVGHLVFIIGGRFVVDEINAGQHLIYGCIGLIFGLTALFQAVRMFLRKDPVQSL
jgi:threonine/homoserine/homoserine lactone efflux protein